MREAELHGAPRERAADVIVEVARELDVHGAERLWEELREAIAMRHSVTLDMSYCRFLDSTGLTVVIRAARALRRRNRGLVVFGLTGQPRRIFDLTRVAENAGIDFAFPRSNRASLATEDAEPA
jgi:anti-anti-sigma factor